MGALSDAFRAHLDRMAELDRETETLLADMADRARAAVAELEPSDWVEYSDADHLADARELLEAHGYTVTPPQ